VSRGTRDPGPDIRELGADIVWPWISDRIYKRHMLASDAKPARPRELAKRSRGLTIEQNADVVERTVGPSRRIDSVRLSDPVGRRVPPTLGQVEAARECDSVDDDDELLMVGRTDRDSAVQAELHLPRSVPAKRPAGEQLTLSRIDDRIIPKQKMDGQLWPLAHQRREEIWQVLGISIVGLAAAMEIPSDDEDAASSLEQRAPHRAEISRRIDQQRGSRGLHDPPDIAAGLQDHGRFHGRFALQYQ
jgi:hypothetical protein